MVNIVNVTGFTAKKRVTELNGPELKPKKTKD